MLFDVQAALADILSKAPGRCDSCDLSQLESRESQSQPSPSRQDYPPGAIVHLSRYRPAQDRDGRPVRTLPTHPTTCAICGQSDWTVSMT